MIPKCTSAPTGVCWPDNPEWIYLGRGEHREHNDEDGFTVGHVTDEVPSRGIWRHYRRLMEAC